MGVDRARLLVKIHAFIAICVVALVAQVAVDLFMKYTFKQL